MSDLLTDSAVNMLKPMYTFFTLIVCPLFIICMGMNVVFSSKNDADKLIKRGFTLLFVELVFNVVRYVVPGLIGMAFGGVNTADALWICFWMIYGMINGDVLALAGYSFILFGVFKKIGLKPLTIFIISIVMFVIDLGMYQLVGKTLAETFTVFPNEIFGHFVYVNEDSIFPLFRWFIFTASGYLFGSYINNEEVFRKVGIVSFAIVFVLGGYTIYKGENPFVAFNVVENYNELTPFILLSEIGLSYLFICWIFQVYHILKLETKVKFNNFIARFSSLTTYYYLIQWTIVGWIMFISCGIHLWGCKAIGVIPTILLIAFITVVSYPLGAGLKNVVKKHIV